VMRLFERCSMASVLIFLVIGLAAGPSWGAYEVWQCGQCSEFNCQGYDNQSTIQFRPFGHKIDDYYRLNLDATKVLAINPAAGGGYYAYMMWRVNNAPILWISLNNGWGLIEWDTLFATCSYNVDSAMQCVDFEDPVVDTYYAVGAGLTDSGQTMTFTPFQWSNSSWTSGGFGQVVEPDWCESGGTGQALLLNNINVQFAFPTLADGLVIQFGEHGGNVNIAINGDFRNASNFAAVVSPVGGVAVSCTGAGCTGGGHGTLYLVGTVNSLSIGGQEFCLDDVCPRTGD
jgi:hypothetical protein